MAIDEQDQPYAIQDPQATWLMANAAKQREAPEAALDALLSRTDFWGTQLPQHPDWRHRVAHWHRQVLAQGVDRAIEQLLQAAP